MHSVRTELVQYQSQLYYHQSMAGLVYDISVSFQSLSLLPEYDSDGFFPMTYDHVFHIRPYQALKIKIAGFKVWRISIGNIICQDF